MVDILLIQPPIRDFYLTSKRTVPYGLACIAASLMKAGFSVDICDALAVSRSKALDLPPEMGYLATHYGKPDMSPFSLFHQYRHYGYSFEHIGKIARDSGAFLVGISSLFTPYRDEAIQTAKRVKTCHPNCSIVLGGHHPTALPHDVMSEDAVDYVLRGEGEVAMPMLAKAIQSGDTIASIPGIVFRDSEETVHISDPAFLSDLDSQPLPAVHLVKNAYYKRKQRGSAVIVTSRGCPMTCSYCAIGSSGYGSYRRRSVESVIKEMDQAVTRYGAGFIDFEDENLSLNKAWFLDLLSRITNRYRESGLELRAMNGLFPPTLDEDVVRSMKSAGFKILNLSMGSTSLDQLRRFQRPDVSQSVTDVLKLAEKYDLEAVVYVIGGAPGQSAEDTVNDLLFLASHKALAGMSIFYPAPESRDYNRCAVMGVLPQRWSLMRSSAFPISHTTTRVESVTLLRLARILNFLKSLTRDEMKAIHPLSFSKTTVSCGEDRKTIGIQMLQSFFHDGIIRGVTPDGEIYKHHISEKLAHLFIKGLKF